MVKLTVAGADEKEGFEELPAMRDVELLCKDIEFLAAENDWKPRLKFIFEIIDGEDVADEHVGAEHWAYANMPGGKSGKLKSNSNLYKLLEGMSGGDFDPDDEIDTDQFVGKKFVGDFKRVQKHKNIGTGAKPEFVLAFNDDGTPIKKTELAHLRPVRPAGRRRRPESQEGFDWSKDEDADDAA